MKLYKDITVKINGKNYVILYKTKLGFIYDIKVFGADEFKAKEIFQDLEEINCNILEISTIKDWFQMKLIYMFYKLGNKKRQ